MTWRRDLASRLRVGLAASGDWPTTIVYDSPPDQIETPAVVVSEGDPSVERLDAYRGREFRFSVWTVVSRAEVLAQADRLDDLVEAVLTIVEEPGGAPYSWESVSALTADERNLSRTVSVTLQSPNPRP